MYIKLMGAGLILAGCGGCGIRIALLHRREVAALRQLMLAVDGMLCELEYRLTPLPELCRLGGEYSRGAVQDFFSILSRTMDEQGSPDVWACIRMALARVKALPSQTVSELEILGRSLGKFDLQGQLNALLSCKASCQNRLEKLEFQQDKRLRSYQTLGFCAGAALAILLF